MPVLNGRMAAYINLDNAASTPPLRSVVEAVNRFLPVLLERASRRRIQVPCQHRGLRRRARHDRPLRRRRPEHATRSSSARTRPRRSTSSPIDSRWRTTSVVLSTEMEHHSNDLPWRARARRDPGARDRRRPARRRRRRPAARGVWQSGRAADGVRAHPMSPVSSSRSIAWRVRRTRSAPGSWSMPRSSRRTGGSTSSRTTIPEHLDYVAISAHKMYAPFGTGALIGRRDTFLQRRARIPGRRHGRDRDARRRALGRAAGS